MKKLLIFQLVMIGLTLLISISPGLGIRAGVGKYYPADSGITGVRSYAGLLAIRLEFGEPFILHAGIKVNQLRDDTVTFSTDSGDVGSIIRRLTGTAVFGAGGVGILVGSESFGVYPYGLLGAGLMGVSSSVRWEWGDQGDGGLGTTPFAEKPTSFDYRPFIDAFAGVEVRFWHVAVFIQVDHFICKAVEYSGLEVSDFDDPLPGGELTPSGTTFYIGAALR